MILPNKFYVDWAIRTEVKEGRAFLQFPSPSRNRGTEDPSTYTVKSELSPILWENQWKGNLS